ncbi:hypothetical protein MHC_04340 [Mycoplasma haemocanis str. Illinois]|uniref:Uncharacterized protein n=1 Tax=Mycoplasma haemocanis (strain Illinois) TaxID=1111676 RepID=H6N7V2_MYCHN|nr:DUF3713 domain-containing protein [Mycoplasma haemocanis]AEW45724.1 hypothetical protein MHC_04340 [Mycoplasma haemocanis str. Illinois]
MLFTKRIFFLSGLTSGGYWFFYNSDGGSGLELDEIVLEDIRKATESLNKVSFSSGLDPYASQSSNPFAYSLFASNLDTFTKKLYNNFYDWVLFQWADNFLLSENSNKYAIQKRSIYSELLNRKEEYKKSDKPSPKNWSLVNHIISSSKDVLEKSFQEVFLNTLHISGAEFKGEEGYEARVVEFQKFLYEKWLFVEKPVLLCTKDWAYSTAFSNTLYSSIEGKDGPQSSNFNFPDISDSSGFSTFKSKLNSGPCSDSDYKLWTISELSELKDGYKLSAILHQSNGQSKNGQSDSSGSEGTPGLFMSSSSSSSDNFPINSEIFNSSSSSSSSLKSNKSIVSHKDLQVKDGTGTYSRNNSGFSFFYKNKQYADVKTTLLKNTDKFTQVKLTEELKKFFKSRSGEIIASFLSNRNTALFGSPLSDRFSVMLRDATNFSEQLRKNGEMWKMLSSFSSVFKENINVEWESSSGSMVPKKNHGLVTPILFKRNFDSNTALSESKWLDAIKENNDGNYPELTKHLFSGWNKKDELYERSLKLRKSIFELINASKVSNAILGDGIFFNDYVLDNVFFDFKQDEKLFRDTIKNIAILNALDFNWFKNDLDGFSKRLLRHVGLQNMDKSGIQDSIRESVIDVFYGNSYQKEVPEDRLNYGGYKYEKEFDASQSKFCARKLKNDKGTFKEEINSCTKVNDNRNQYRQKLINYWLLKNYFFNSHGYEVSSKESTQYIHFLYSIYWLVNENFNNLRSFLVSHIPNNRYGALVWKERVEKSSWSKSKSKDESSDIGKSKQSKKEIENPEMYFSSSNLDEIFSPFASTSISVPKSLEDKMPLYADKISAFAITGKDEYTEFHGFDGFNSPMFGSLSKELKQLIFADGFSDNKSYLFDGDSQHIIGTAFGAFSSEGWGDIDGIIDSFKHKNRLKWFVNSFFPAQSDILNSWISEEDSKVALDAVADISLDQMKSKVKEIFKDKKGAYAAAISRFSGFVKSSGSTTDENQRYFIPDSQDSNKGWIIYVTQVNRNDMLKGFDDFVKVIGFRTLFRTAFSLANQDSLKSKAVNQEYLDKNLVF